VRRIIIVKPDGDRDIVVAIAQQSKENRNFSAIIVACRRAATRLYAPYHLGVALWTRTQAAPMGRRESGMATVLNRIDGLSTGRTAANDSEDGYRPSPDEPFMSLRQQAYFRTKLIRWKEAILLDSQDTLSQLQVDSLREADLTDRAASETDWSIELRTRDRQRKLIGKIEAAIRRIDEGEYGYCEVTGEPISLGRLEARPIATMTVEAQERHERHEKISRED
jgi:DnaK suppressor protein